MLLLYHFWPRTQRTLYSTTETLHNMFIAALITIAKKKKKKK